MTMLMSLTLILNAVAIFALIGLLYVYFKNLKRIKSKFTIGLAMFAILFLFQNILSLYFNLTMMQQYTPAFELYQCFFIILQSIAFVILLVITWE